MYSIPNGTSADWTLLNFDDSSWSEGNAGIGYGDDDDETIISPTIALFMRKTFEIQADLRNFNTYFFQLSN
jgi:hypothetical protein